MNCQTCGRELSGRQTKFCSRSCKNNRPSFYAYLKPRAIERKKMFVEELGGQCSRCGYKGNLSALHFHHINPEDKIHQLDQRHLSNTSIDKLRIELKKCMLLCANCHAEEHNPNLAMQSI